MTRYFWPTASIPSQERCNFTSCTKQIKFKQTPDEDDEEEPFVTQSAKKSQNDESDVIRRKCRGRENYRQGQ